MRDYKKAFIRIESLLLKSCIICILILIGLQMIISHNDLSVFIEKSISNENTFNNSNYSEKGVIILKILDEKYEGVEVLINGEDVGNFSKSNELTLNVYSNDLIEINGTKYLDKIKVKVVGISKNIKFPKLNSVVTTSKNIEILGKVIIK